MGIFTFAPKAVGGNKKGLFFASCLLVTCKFQGLFLFAFRTYFDVNNYHTRAIPHLSGLSFRFDTGGIKNMTKLNDCRGDVGLRWRKFQKHILHTFRVVRSEPVMLKICMKNIR